MTWVHLWPVVEVNRKPWPEVHPRLVAKPDILPEARSRLEVKPEVRPATGNHTGRGTAKSNRKCDRKFVSLVIDRYLGQNHPFGPSDYGIKKLYDIRRGEETYDEEEEGLRTNCSLSDANNYDNAS